MAEQVLKNVGIWLDGRDFAGVSNSVGIAVEADAPESTTFADEWRTRSAGGLKTSSLSLEGWYDIGDIDNQQFGGLGADGGALIVPAGMMAGDVAYVVPYTQSAWEPGASIGELMAWTWAGEGDGAAHRAGVFDIRERITGVVTTPRIQLGPVPGGQALRLWLHAHRENGQMAVDLQSATAQTGGTTTQRGQHLGVAETGEIVLTVLGPVTDEWWFLSYTPATNAEFDVASASSIAARQVLMIPQTPIIPPVTPMTHNLLGGLSTNPTPVPSELTINPDAGNAGRLSFTTFSMMHVLIARLASEPFITSISVVGDPTMANQLSAFTLWPNPIAVSGSDYNVWVSNQLLASSFLHLEIS